MSFKFFCDWCGTDIVPGEPMFRLEYHSGDGTQEKNYDFDSLDHMRQKLQQVQQTGVL